MLELQCLVYAICLQAGEVDKGGKKAIRIQMSRGDALACALDKCQLLVLNARLHRIDRDF